MAENIIGAGSRARQFQRGSVLITALFLGLVVGGTAVVFLLACHAVTRFALGTIVGYHAQGPAGEWAWIPPGPQSPLHVWLLVPVAAAGGLITGWLITRVSPEVAGPGTDAVVRAYHDPAGRIRARVPLIKLLATAVTVGTGGSGGREGPIAQIGAGIGSTLGDLLRFTARDRRLLLAAGMGAGVAAVFRAPLAGALFASEVLYRSDEFEPEVLLPSAVAAAAADAVAGCVFGWNPLLPAPARGFWSLAYIPAYALLVVVLVVLARAYVASFHATGRAFRFAPLPLLWKPALGAGMAALVGVALYWVAGRDTRALAVLGFGLGTLQDVLIRPDEFTLGVLLTIAFGKIATTSLTVGSGGSGGVFGPTLVIGGCGGAALGLVLQPIGPAWVPPPTAFALLGMAGFFSASAKTPFSTLVMVCEVTGDLALIAPALGVCIGCFALSGSDTLFRSQPAARDLSPARHGETAAEPRPP